VSGSAEKARRRDLRRALGTEAVAHVDAVAQQFEAFRAYIDNAIVPNLNTLTTVMQEQQTSIRALRELIIGLEHRIAALESERSTIVKPMLALVR
jgi:hypothetical protein